MIDAVLLAELGPNPAALAEALWALPRLHDTRVTDAFVLTSPAGYAWFEEEIVASTVYDQLQACLGDLVPAFERLHLRVAMSDDELSPADADAWNEARWANATAALRAAGDRPVVFALAGGRQRTSASLTTVMYQLLARPQDRLVDVRVGDRRVEGARAGFFFPEQARQLLQSDGESFLARDVPVHLVDVRVPRLRRLLNGSDMSTWADALAAGQRAVEEVPRLELALDLRRRTITLNGHPAEFQQAEFVWITTLALARAHSVEDGWVLSGSIDALRDAMKELQAREPSWTPQSASLEAVLTQSKMSNALNAALRKHRSAAARRWKKLLETLGLGTAAVARWSLRQEALPHPTTRRKVVRWRLPLDPTSIQILP